MSNALIQLPAVLENQGNADELSLPFPAEQSPEEVTAHRIGNIEKCCQYWDITCYPGEVREVYFGKHPRSYSEATAKMECAVKAYLFFRGLCTTTDSIWYR